MEPSQSQKIAKAKKLLLILAIVSIVMFFAGLTSMHIVSRGGSIFWLDIKMPSSFLWSTGLMLLSSLTMIGAVRAVKKNNQQGLKLFLVLSLALGLGFVYSQFQGWGYLADKGMHLQGSFLEHLKGDYGTDYVLNNQNGVMIEYRDGHFYDPNDPTGQTIIDEEINSYRNPAARNMITLTGLHALHVGGGILWLIYLVVIALMGRLSPDKSLKVTQGAIYWHFVDFLWIYLLLFLYNIH